MAWADGLGDLSRMCPPGHVLGSHSLLDAIYFLLVAFSVPHGILLGLFQRTLQGLDAFCGSTKPLLQLGEFTAQICIVPDQLLVHLGKLFQVVLQEGDLLLLSSAAPSIVAVQLHTLFHPGCQILDEEFAQVMKGLEFSRHSLLQSLEVLPGLLPFVIEQSERQKGIVSH